MSLTLNCFVVGDNPHEHTFPIVFNIKDRTEAMESQYSFQRAKYRRQQKISKLSPLDEVSENFPDQPSQKNIYLIIQQGVNREDSSRMNRAQTNNNVNEDNRCESGYSFVSISIQSMISTTTSMPSMPKGDNPEGQYKKDEEENIDEIKNLM
ncbi:1_t:CDS:2, partial [Gigaspora rosea]